MRKLLAPFALALAIRSFADTITFDGKVYDDVYVSQTKSFYIICFPDNGRSQNLDKSKVKEGDIVLTEDAIARKSILERWNDSYQKKRDAEEAKREVENEKVKREQEVREQEVRDEEQKVKARQLQNAEKERVSNIGRMIDAIDEIEKLIQQVKSHPMFDTIPRVAGLKFEKIESDFYKVKGNLRPELKSGLSDPNYRITFDAGLDADLDIIRKQFSESLTILNSKLPAVNEVPQQGQTKIAGELKDIPEAGSSSTKFYDPSRAQPYWANELSRHSTRAAATSALADQFDRSTPWIEANMGPSNELLEIHKNLNKALLSGK